MMHIALDLDDVILDFCGGVRHAVKTEYGVDVPDFDDWDLAKVLDPVLGQSWWKWLRTRDWLWPNFRAVDGAIGGIETLRREGHYLEIVTSKPDWAEYAVWKWLGKWRPHVQRVTILDTNSGTAKTDVTDAELLVDDKPENIEDFLSAGRKGILFERPHNISVDTTWSYIYGHDVKYARDWNEVLKGVRGWQASAGT